MIIILSNTLTIGNPTKEIQDWCKRELTLPNPVYTKKARMGFWLGNTPKTISLYEIRGDTLVLPYGALSQIPKELMKSAIFLEDFKVPVEVDYRAEVPLYDYQEKAVEVLIQAERGILQSPPGSGKTQMGIALAGKLGVRTLWLCHTLDLVSQSRDRAKMYMSEDLLGTITEGKVVLGEGMTFATIQTMSKLDLSRYKNYWDCIITDEVHRVSGSPTAVTQYQKVLNALSARHKYGLSATVHRSDGMIQATYALVGEIAYRVPDEAVKGKIMPVEIHPIGTGVRIGREALNPDGTLNYAKLLAYLTENEDRNAVIAETIELGKSSLILSDRLNHLEAILNLLPEEAQKLSVMISGKTKKEVREKALEEMRQGTKKYLFATYSLAKEGLDVPRLERLYLTTPQKDFAVVTQSIGRIARTFPNKGIPIAYDFVDNIEYAVRAYKKRCTIYRKNGNKILEE